MAQLSCPGVDFFHFGGCKALDGHQGSTKGDLQCKFLQGALGSVR